MVERFWIALAAMYVLGVLAFSLSVAGTFEIITLEDIRPICHVLFTLAAANGLAMLYLLSKKLGEVKSQVR